MKFSVNHLSILCGAIIALGGFSSQVAAQPLFSDDFEDRVKDQALIGNNWTWYDQTFAGDTCVGEPVSGFGPFDDGDGSDYEQENRNYWTASNDVGQGDSYFRAGLEVPAWADEEGAPVVMNNMMRVYGDQYYAPDEGSCKRTLIFQEKTIETSGTHRFSFDVAQDRFGAPVNGEVTGAFVKILKQSDSSYATILFESIITMPPVATTPENVTTAAQAIEFTVPEELVGELLQFGFYNDSSTNLGQSWATASALYDNVLVDLVDIGPAHSGSWYNDDQSGHGFSMEFGVAADGSPLAVIYWYTFDSMGNPIFMVGSGVPDGQQLNVAFVSPIGMIYGDFDKTTVERPDGGTAVFVFADADNATFSYTPSAFSESEWGHTTPIENLPLVKLFGIAADKSYPSTD